MSCTWNCKFKYEFIASIDEFIASTYAGKRKKGKRKKEEEKPPAPKEWLMKCNLKPGFWSKISTSVLVLLWSSHSAECSMPACVDPPRNRAAEPIHHDMSMKSCKRTGGSTWKVTCGGVSCYRSSLLPEVAGRAKFAMGQKIVIDQCFCLAT